MESRDECIVPFVTEARASNLSEASSGEVRAKSESGFLVVRRRKFCGELTKELVVRAVMAAVCPSWTRLCLESPNQLPTSQQFFQSRSFLPSHDPGGSCPHLPHPGFSLLILSGQSEAVHL